MAGPPAGGALLLLAARRGRIDMALVLPSAGRCQLSGRPIGALTKPLADRLERPVEWLGLLHEGGDLGDDAIRVVEHRPVAGAEDLHVAAVLDDLVGTA